MAHLGEFGRQLAALDVGEGGEQPAPDTFTFHGETFEIPQDVSALPRLRFAHATLEIETAGERVDAMRVNARTDEDDAAWRAEDMAAIRVWHSAIYRYIRDVIGDGQWERFYAVAVRVAADRDELLGVANAVMAVVAGRPPMRSTGSPDGLSSTGDGSMGGSGSTADSDTSSSTPVSTGAAPPVGSVGPLTDRERQAAALDDAMVPVGTAVRSGT